MAKRQRRKWRFTLAAAENVKGGENARRYPHFAKVTRNARRLWRYTFPENTSPIAPRNFLHVPAPELAKNFFSRLASSR
jgi:hypothetical protein